MKKKSFDFWLQESVIFLWKLRKMKYRMLML